jgi:hypothetical protein
MMDILDDFISTVDAMLDSRRKRHITGGGLPGAAMLFGSFHTGGILLSAALLFGGLAITVVTIQTDEEEYEDE